jgi:hypothetical protein
MKAPSLPLRLLRLVEAPPKAATELAVEDPMAAAGSSQVA